MDNKMEELSMDELEAVAGGNDGDSKTDNNPNWSKFQVGQQVEVFTTGIHSSTRRCTITKKEFNKYRDVWVYTVRRLDGDTWNIFRRNCADATCFICTCSEFERK